LIKATSIYGKPVCVSKEKVDLRVSAYGIIFYEGKLLLINIRSTSKWFFPGGGVEIGEKMEETIKREIREETGIRVKVGKFLTFEETCFYYDPWDKAWQNYSFFYICKPLSFDLTEANQIEFDEAEKPQWVSLDALKESDFQFPANNIFKKIKKIYEKS
jgi:mutator protein MutT